MIIKHDNRNGNVIFREMSYATQLKNKKVIAVKRSEINNCIQTAINLLRSYNIFLPQFAYWTPKEWEQAGESCKMIWENCLGWDVTDFGSGDFDRTGAVLFTLRNGNKKNLPEGIPYAEKIIILKPGQSIPLHFHVSKTEDIINRIGEVLCVELFKANDDDTVDRASPIEVYCDGQRREIKAGEVIELFAGESITITPRTYHRLYADVNGGMLICGEVSSVSDDDNDNVFAEPVKRYTTIEEDEPALFLLCNEAKIFKGCI